MLQSAAVSIPTVYDRAPLISLAVTVDPFNMYKFAFFIGALSFVSFSLYYVIRPYGAFRTGGCAPKKYGLKVFPVLPSEDTSLEVDTRDLVDYSPFWKESKEVEGNEKEALGSLQAALEMLQAGKLEKAHKLFEHALALSPKHPDVLNHYGEFLEVTKKDIIQADQLYFKALVVSPSHAAAAVNRGRVADLVEEMDQSTLKRIHKKCAALARIPESSQALRRVKREAYFQHIYHTVGIEGNTMTLSQTRSIVETRMAVGGKSIMEHNEILGLDAALKFINTTLINRIGEITTKDILEIHKRVLGFVDPTEGGAFRNTQVFVGGHIPPAPSDIQSLMADFQGWLNSWEAVSMHPVKYAALAHYKLVHIHPFYDGNGRTARLLMNTILMQAGYPPVIILKQDRQRYYRTLEMANEGDIRPFIRFIAECTERTLDLFLWSTSEYSTEIPALASKIIENN